MEALEILTALGFHAQSTVAITEAMQVEQLGVDALTWPRQGRARALSVVDTTPVQAESTASIELASEAEKAIAAKPEALELGVYNEAGRGREVETPPEEGAEALPQEGRRDLGHIS